MTINLAEHVMNLKGRDYLPVAPRIVAFREASPTWSIMTEPVDIRDALYCKAIVLDDAGRVVATAHKVVTSFAGGAFEKAETGAIGRALSLCGYGTLAAQDMDEGEDIADSPAPRRNGATAPAPPPPAKPAAKAPAPAPAPAKSAAPAGKVSEAEGLMMARIQSASPADLDEIRAELEAATTPRFVRMSPHVRRVLAETEAFMAESHQITASPEATPAPEPEHWRN